MMSKKWLQKWAVVVCTLLLISLWTVCAHGEAVSTEAEANAEALLSTEADADTPPSTEADADADANTLPSTEAETPLYTVIYSIQEPVSGVWILYFTEQVREGYLARGPAEPMDPSGKDELLFVGWYEDADNVGDADEAEDKDDADNADGAAQPVNLWRTPILSDMSLHARFGSEADVPVLEGLHPEITFTRTINEDETATITAELMDIPQGVCYTLEWQNDLTGEFLAVPEEIGPSITFPATEESLGCIWRLGIHF